MAERNIAHLTATEARAELEAGTLTSLELVDACLARIAERDSDVGAWAHLNAEAARKSAQEADARRAAGKSVSPLTGIPVGIKDIIHTTDFPTEYGSSVFAGNQTSEDAFIVAQLKAAGAVLLGKTVTTELAFFGPGKTRNPRDLERTPGGSSSGSAAAVADDQVFLALGSQTAGSTIRPASYCGTVGFKPTFGYTSRTGVLPQSEPLDTLGGYARSVDDIALLFDAISAHDPADTGMAPGNRPSLVDALAEPGPKVPRFAYVRSPGWPQAEAAMKAAFDDFAGSFGARAEVVETPLPAEFDEILRLQQIVQFSDIARNYGPIADANPDAISAKLKEIIAEGRTFSSSNYAAAREEQESLYEALCAVLGNYDAILTPAATGVAPIGLASTGSPVFNGLWTYLGMPCISLPLIEIDGLPVGVQLTSARGSDAALLRVAKWMTTDKGARG
ncbi:amidase [Hyphomicrobium methylovorum]|uniref:amidase n=1 Tax=Hyphomicrobium methylovorum TaxID=84 RepID=UPI0015E62C60|nr:amidase [Hyphomicrobium methylovorum]MBA2126610.1 amidase [Hyphomicrobium methylovorum]